MMKKFNFLKARKDGGYTRVFGNKNLGALFSFFHSLTISAGFLLEKIIFEHCQPFILSDAALLESFFSNIETLPLHFYVIPKNILKKYSFFNFSVEPDFLIVNKNERIIYIVELKDGDAFDTKKSLSEFKNLKNYQNFISAKLPFTTKIKICCFNQIEKRKIFTGFKKKFSLEEIWSGKDLCSKLNLNFNLIKTEREKYQEYYLNHFLDELVKITPIKASLLKKLNFVNKIKKE